MESTIRSGYGWITPDGACLNVQDPSQLTPAILVECQGIMQMFNITTSRDDRFYLDLFNYPYSKGYLRVSKHQDTLGVEGYTDQSIKAHESLLLEISHALTHKGQPLKLQTFVTTAGDPLNNPDRARIFPRQ